jgi:hypothetical protein
MSPAGFLLFELGQALGRISALALIKLRRVSLSAFERKYAGRSLRPWSKKPGAVFPPGSSRSFDECALLEDSRYMSQECLVREFDQPKNMR